jgi:SAM-dependent methyltransferase
MSSKSVTHDHQHAVDVHSNQADLFADRYAIGTADPYANCFAYSRHRLVQHLDLYLPRAGHGGSLLDVGCGTGHWMKALADRGYIVSGVDASPAMLVHARTLNPHARVEQADVNSLPFEDATFDYVLSVEVLRYLADPQPAIRELARVLKPGGVALVTAAPLMNLNGYWLINHMASRATIGNLTPLRQYFTTSRTLRRRFLAAGFDAAAVHGVYVGPLNWIERLFRPGLTPFLRRWERIDRTLADRAFVRELANMYLVHAVRA